MGDTADTIIVNGYNLMWHEATIDEYDPNFFFFKEDPVDYLRLLSQDRWPIGRRELCSLWHIILYWHRYLNIEIDNYPGKIDDIGRVTTKQHIIDDLFSPFAAIIYVAEDDDSINDVLNFDQMSPASFSIANTFPPGDEDRHIAQYSPQEIFETVNPYLIAPDTKYFIVTSSDVRRQELLEQYGNDTTKPQYLAPEPVSFNQKEREDAIYQFRARYPQTPIVQIWSPVYQYRPNDYMAKGLIDRPDYDNIPNVTYYTHGY